MKHKEISNDTPGFSPGDILVVPFDFEVPQVEGLNICKVKNLLKPSIIHTRGHIMNTTKPVTNSSGFKLSKIYSMIFGGKKTEPVEEAISQSLTPTTSTPRSLMEGEDYTETLPPPFFRHLRIAESETWDLSSKGGITFLIQLYPNDKSFNFSYALCNPHDLFNKRTGRSICSTRMAHGDVYSVINHNPVLSLADNIGIALREYLTPTEEVVTLIKPKIAKASKRVNEDDLKKIVRLISDDTTVD